MFKIHAFATVPLLLTPALHAGGHGIDIGASCTGGPVCVGSPINCTLSVEYADDFDDTVRITGAFSIVDPDGDAIRVPPDPGSNLSNVVVFGNAAFDCCLPDASCVEVNSSGACLALGGVVTFPILIGPPLSTTFDAESGLTLPGFLSPGELAVTNDVYVVPELPAGLLIVRHLMTFVDLCDMEPGGTGCVTIEQTDSRLTGSEVTNCCPANLSPPAGTVDVDDLLTVINDWGCTDPPSACAGDVSGATPGEPDGAVDAEDVLFVINAWGLCPAP